jgi:hypothetical protein
MNGIIQYPDDIDPMECWEGWVKLGKFDGLEIPQAYTASMVQAILCLDERNINGYMNALSKVMSWGTTSVTREERVKFIHAYAVKSGYSAPPVKPWSDET